MKAFKIFTRSTKEVKFLDELKTRATELNATVERPVRRMNSSYIFTVPDCSHPQLLTIMRQHEIFDYEVFNPNFKPRDPLHRRSELGDDFDPDIVAKRYLSYDEACTYIDEMAARIHRINPKISAKVQDEGKSYENRKIKSITVKHSEKADNPTIFIDAGIHAREWHSRSMALYLLKKLADEAMLTNGGIIGKASFVILPGVNPDGYEFSRQGNKLWRKTRSKTSSETCVGVDGNRNFEAHWEQGKYLRE